MLHSTALDRRHLEERGDLHWPHNHMQIAKKYMRTCNCTLTCTCAGASHTSMAVGADDGVQLLEFGVGGSKRAPTLALTAGESGGSYSNSAQFGIGSGGAQAGGYA